MQDEDEDQDYEKDGVRCASLTPPKARPGLQPLVTFKGLALD